MIDESSTIGVNNSIKVGVEDNNEDEVNRVEVNKIEVKIDQIEKI